MLWWTLQNVVVAGVLAAIAELVCRSGRMRRALGGGERPGPSFAMQVEALSERLRITCPRIRIVPSLATPVIWSVDPRRPALLWPARFPTRVSAEGRAGLIVHELAH